MTLASIPSLLAVLFCAALFILLYQYLFPRPAPWKLVATALGSGIAFTLLLLWIMTYLLPSAHEDLINVTSLSDALPVAIFRAGLPEELIKGLAALLVVVLFRRHLTAAAAFQIPLFVAVGFAIVENNGYSDAFPEYRMIIAFGRGFMATFIHSLLAMIQGVFLMRLVVQNTVTTDLGLEPGGIAQVPVGHVVWSRWYFLVIAFLAAATCHSLYDWGFLPLLAEFLKTGTVEPVTAVPPLLVGMCGVILLFVSGICSLRIATRRAAALDPIVNEPAHRATVSTWRKAGTAFMVLGAVGFVGAIAWAFLAGEAAAEVANADNLRRTMIVACSVLGSLFAIIFGWVARQKR